MRSAPAGLLTFLLLLLPLAGCKKAEPSPPAGGLAARVSGEAIESRLGPGGLKDREAGADDAQGTLEIQGAPYIVGGVEAQDWPFAVALVREVNGKAFYYCGGTLILNRWVLTAAHCKPAKGNLVILNRRDLRHQGGIVTRAEDVIRHPGFDSETYQNDIALVRLAAPGAPSIPKVRLGAPPAAGDPVTAIGWGAVFSGGPQSAILRQVTVPVADRAQCGASYQTFGRDITSSMVCAGDRGKDSCQGDSGGPLLVGAPGQAYQAGIVSFGVSCGAKGYPGVYTRVDRYIDWIKQNVY